MHTHIGKTHGQIDTHTSLPPSLSPSASLTPALALLRPSLPPSCPFSLPPSLSLPPSFPPSFPPILPLFPLSDISPAHQEDEADEREATSGKEHGTHSEKSAQHIDSLGQTNKGWNFRECNREAEEISGKEGQPDTHSEKSAPHTDSKTHAIGLGFPRMSACGAHSETSAPQIDRVKTSAIGLGFARMSVCGTYSHTF